MKNVNIGSYAFIQLSIPLADKLKKAGEMGYTGVELLAMDLENHSTQELKDMLSESGLACISIHASMDKISPLMEKFAALGGKTMICPSYPFATAEEALACARLLEEKGREAQKYGIKIGYHNHRSEFYLADGKPLLEIVIENTDPELVFFQLDCGWAAAAGVNCQDFIRKYPGRFFAIHVKENNREIGADKPRSAGDTPPAPPKLGPDGKPVMSPEMQERIAEMRKMMSIQCPLGDPSSRIDWNAIYAATQEQGIPCDWTVEREYDYAGDMLKCLEEDCAWLKANIPD